MDYNSLKNLYNSYLNKYLSSSGLASKCRLNLGSQNIIECSNCIYDPILKKSSNIYKSGGPIPFDIGQICPNCRGSGLFGDLQTTDIYMAILWDYKSWIIKPINLENPNGYIQSICNREYLNLLLQTQDMSVLNTDINPPVFILDGQPTPAGLGDQNYIISQWKKIRV